MCLIDIGLLEISSSMLGNFIFLLLLFVSLIVLFTDNMTTTCSSGKVYSSCIPLCQATCQSNSQQACILDSDICTPGCVCPAGKVDYNGTCISQTTCPCYHNGKEYGERTKIQKDCNTW